ncbi:MAG: hypothetical protein KAV87_12960 [Desulfobacteraceae bacterium]|nr:hypothetical protein [Desulfobacteraceae bacterium]
MIPLLATAIPSLLGKAFDTISDLFPSEKEKQIAKAKVMQAQLDGKFKEMELGLGAILAEANSKDPWTSRARPAFLYVMYLLMLFAIPMGFLSAYDPEMSARVSEGFKSWLGAIPEPMWYLFGTGYLGYTGARTYDKHKAKQ